MSISLSNNPFITQSKEIVPARLTKTSLPVSLRQPLDVAQSRLSQPSQNVDERFVEKPSQLFSLPPTASSENTAPRLEKLVGNRIEKSSIINYLTTENLARREKLASLARLDVFA